MLSNQDYEMIAVRMSALWQPVIDALQACCKRTPQFVEDAIPCGAIPFRFTGSVPQRSNQHVLINATQAPPGHSGVINSIAFVERYPGTLYGVHFFLLIDGVIHTDFNRVDHNVGTLEHPQRTHICINEGQVVSVMNRCVWTPFSFPGQVEYIQTIFPYEVRGYWLPQEYFEPENILEF